MGAFFIKCLLLTALASLSRRVDTKTASQLLLSTETFMYMFFFQAHISSQNSELSNAALQALGFCVFNSTITSELSGKRISVDAGNVCVYICISEFFLYVFVSVCFNFDKVYSSQVVQWFCL